MLRAAPVPESYGATIGFQTSQKMAWKAIGRKRRKMSAATRKKMAASAKKRWAAKKEQ
jgi:hypothetical protein